MHKIIKNKLIKPPSILIYSEAGIGKTTLASNAPNPVFLCTEEGLGKLEVDCSDRITTIDEFTGYTNELLHGEHNYKTIVVDSLDHLKTALIEKFAKILRLKVLRHWAMVVAMCVSHICGDEPSSNIKSSGLLCVFPTSVGMNRIPRNI